GTASCFEQVRIGSSMRQDPLRDRQATTPLPPPPADDVGLRGAALGREIAMDIVLYYAPNACSLVPYVTLTEAIAAFEVRPLNFRKGQQMSADYLKLNAKHKVPLVVVDGKTLTESVAFQTFIARTFHTI